jgi:thioredoxin reductase (NADPH)
MADFDLVILGAGPAGLTAALYAGRSKINTAVLERGIPGGQAAATDRIENYPGFPGGVGGIELAERMEKHAREFGASFIPIEVARLQEEGRSGQNEFSITGMGEVEKITSRCVIVATGTKERNLDVPGEKEFRGRGVSYCATCDGAFFDGKLVAVIGGGDSAVEEALYLTRYASKVMIIHRRNQLRANKSLQERAFQNERIQFFWDSVVEAIEGPESGFVERLKVKNLRTGDEVKVKADGVFIYVGQTPNTDFTGDLVSLDRQGYIITNEDLETSVKGVLAAGDVRQKSLRQVSTAVGDGALAAMNATKFLEQLV